MDRSTCYRLENGDMMHLRISTHLSAANSGNFVSSIVGGGKR